MRHVVTLLALLALVAALVIEPPFAAAKKKGGNDAALAKLEREARASAKGILRAASKGIRARSGVAARRIKELVKAVKKGKGLDRLTGVPNPSKGPEPSSAQLRAAFDLYAEILFEFQGGTTTDVEAAYAQLRADPAYGSLSSASSTDAYVGGGGLVDVVARDLRGTWGDARAGLVRASRQLQAALRAHDFDLTVAPFDPPRLAPPPLAGPQGEVLPIPVVLEVLGSSDGDLVVMLPSRRPPLFDEYGVQVEVRHLGSGLVQRVTPSATSTAATIVRFAKMPVGAIAVSSGVPLGKDLLPLTRVGITVPPGGGTATSTAPVVTEPSVSLVVGGKRIDGAVFDQAVVQPASGRVEAIFVMARSEEASEPLLSVDFFSSGGFVPAPGVPFEIRIPPIRSSQDRASVLYYPSGTAGPTWGTFSTTTSTIAVTFGGDPVAEAVDLILIGDIFLSSSEAPEKTVPAHLEIRVPAKLVDRFF